MVCSGVGGLELTNMANLNQEPNAGGDSKQLCKQWFRRLTSGQNLVSPAIWAKGLPLVKTCFVKVYN